MFYIIIRLKARLRPDIGFTLRGNLAVFTRSAINSAESEPILVKSGALWVHCWGGGRWTEQILGVNCAAATVWLEGWMPNVWFRPQPLVEANILASAKDEASRMSRRGSWFQARPRSKFFWINICLDARSNLSSVSMLRSQCQYFGLNGGQNIEADDV